MTLNVNRNVTDVFYRYKMPKLVAKVEGKGNGIKTVIVNMSDVAKALDCPPTYPCKFFGCELGAQTQFNFKDDRYIVNGSHEAGKLQQLLDVFIKKFILCTECENPETTLLPNEKKQIIRQTCKACGHQAMMDMRHKLTTYILKNPPDVKIDQLGSSKTQKKDRSKPQAGGSPNGERETNGGGNDDDWDDDDWGEDTSDAAVASRMQDLSAGVKHLTLSSQASKSQREKNEIFFEYVKAKKESGVLVPGAEVAVFKDISAEAESMEIKEGKAVMALVELLLDENIVKQIAQFRILFLLFTANCNKSQKYLLGAIEKLVELKKEALLPKVPHILKELYDRDIVVEEVFLEWGAKASKKYVSKELSEQIQAKALPFIKWLKEAEETESESSEDDLEIEYDEKARAVALKDQEAKAAPKKVQVAEVVNKKGEEEEDEGSDIDIDDI